MAWIFLAVSEDLPKPLQDMSRPSLIAKTTDTPKPSYCRVCQTDHYPPRPYGTTYELLDEKILPICQTLSMAGFHAKTLVLQDAEQVWRESEADYFSRSSDLQTKFDPNSSSWKTCQLSGLEAQTLSSGKWPASGMIVDGSLYPLPKSERTTKGTDGGYWPTPRAGKTSSENPETWTKRQRAGKVATPPLAMAVKMWPTPRTKGMCGGTGNFEQMKKLEDAGVISETERKQMTAGNGGQLNPTWVEWLMGYPSGWTVLEAWAMRWFQPKQEKLSKD